MRHCGDSDNLPCHVSRVSHAREARRDLGQRKRNWQGPRKYAAKVAFHFWFVCSSLLSTLTASTAPSFEDHCTPPCQSIQAEADTSTISRPVRWI